MKFRNIDENNDWTFGSGLNNYARDINAVKLNVKTRIQCWLRDCFLALDEGVDWINRLGSLGQKENLDDEIRLVILQTEGVTGINEYSSSVDETTREYAADYDIETIYSQSFQDRVLQAA